MVVKLTDKIVEENKRNGRNKSISLLESAFGKIDAFLREEPPFDGEKYDILHPLILGSISAVVIPVALHFIPTIKASFERYEIPKDAHQLSHKRFFDSAEASIIGGGITTAATLYAYLELLNPRLDVPLEYQLLAATPLITNCLSYVYERIRKGRSEKKER